MSDLFNRIIVPLLYGPDSTSVWRVDRSKISSSPLSRSSLPTDKSLTYGEVLPSSVERHVLPLLALRDGDVVVDLGSGTGKIPLQIALAARALGLNGVSCRGVELARERHDAARRAYAKLSCISPADVEDLLGDEIASNRSSSTDASSLWRLSSAVWSCATKRCAKRTQRRASALSCCRDSFNSPRHCVIGFCGRGRFFACAARRRDRRLCKQYGL